MQYYSIKKREWDEFLLQLLSSHIVFATVSNESGHDYELIEPAGIERISYNHPKPATPLKTFFLPFRENVTSLRNPGKPRIILGIPNCDIEALNLTDSIYLDRDFSDMFYRERRENTILISSDCFSTQEHCHCTTYSIHPYASEKADLAVISIPDDTIVFRVISQKGMNLIESIPGIVSGIDHDLLMTISEQHERTEAALNSSNVLLPDSRTTGILISKAGKEVWDRYSARCVSCGACSAICPTCTCFLLIDKPGFEKVKQTDSCQYPGFERVAGGEDALFKLDNRFKNRYLCKYVWKPQKFDSTACTGCGRCIEACIGKINKNEIFLELTR